MSKGKVRIEGDFGARRFRDNFTKAQQILDSQVLSDTTPYVPRDGGSLYQSAIYESELGSGKLVWGAPYSRAQYEGLPNKARDRHPLAVMRWFEYSKQANLAKWLRVAKKEAGR